MLELFLETLMNEKLEFECKVMNHIPIKISSDTIRVSSSNIFGLDKKFTYFEKCYYPEKNKVVAAAQVEQQVFI